MEKYLKAIKENICSICADSSETGKCTLNEREVCAVQYFLPEIIDVVHKTDSDEIEDYYKNLKNVVCHNCRAQDSEGDCYLREDSNCSLDRYFRLIVETIQKVDEQAA